jgi:hypothetical protein
VKGRCDRKQPEHAKRVTSWCEALGKGVARPRASAQAVIRIIGLTSMQVNIVQIPKPYIADADLVEIWGKLELGGKRALRAPLRSAGVLMTACEPWRTTATRETLFCDVSRKAKHQPRAREGQTEAREGVGEVRSTARSRVTPVEGRDLSLGTRQEEEKAGRLA